MRPTPCGAGRISYFRGSADPGAGGVYAVAVGSDPVRQHAAPGAEIVPLAGNQLPARDHFAVGVQIVPNAVDKLPAGGHDVIGAEEVPGVVNEPPAHGIGAVFRKGPLADGIPLPSAAAVGGRVLVSRTAKGVGQLPDRAGVVGKVPLAVYLEPAGEHPAPAPEIVGMAALLQPAGRHFASGLIQVVPAAVGVVVPALDHPAVLAVEEPLAVRILDPAAAGHAGAGIGAAGRHGHKEGLPDRRVILGNGDDGEGAGLVCAYSEQAAFGNGGVFGGSALHLPGNVLTDVFAHDFSVQLEGIAGLHAGGGSRHHDFFHSGDRGIAGEDELRPALGTGAVGGIRGGIGQGGFLGSRGIIHVLIVELGRNGDELSSGDVVPAKGGPGDEDLHGVALFALGGFVLDQGAVDGVQRRIIG